MACGTPWAPLKLVSPPFFAGFEEVNHMKKNPGWAYILLEGYCLFDIYSSKKKTTVYTFPGNDFNKEPSEERLVKNDFYVPKSKLRKPRGCPGHPCSDCLGLHCRFFSYCDGRFSQMPYKTFKMYRARDAKLQAISGSTR